MKDLRCVFGRHTWTSQLPAGTPVRPTQHLMACRRCSQVIDVNLAQNQGSSGQGRKRLGEGTGLGGFGDSRG